MGRWRTRRSSAALAFVLVVGPLLLGACGQESEDDDASVVELDPEQVEEAEDTVADGPPPTEPTEEQLADSDALFADIDQDGPGCAAAVSVGGEQPWAGGWGVADVESGDELSEDTVFDVGSTSKPFTATLVLLLAERGDLELDAPLSDVLDDLPDWADQVTLDQMLHHTSGIPDYVDLLYDEGFEDTDRTTDEDALEALGEVEDLDFEPGDHFEYSNSGYFLAAEAVEEATGEDFADVVAEELFGPYDLAAEVDPVTDDPLKARSYVADSDGWAVADSAWEQVGDGGVQTSPTQLVWWASELWSPLVGDQVADARLADPVDDGEGLRYGAGIVIDEHDELGTVLSHSGSWAGFVTDLVVLPDDQVAAAVSCNTPDVLDPTEAAYALVEIWQP